MSKHLVKYESEFTQFLAELKQNNPQLEQQQCAGYALLRDKPIDLEQIARDQTSYVKRRGYFYQ